MSEEYNPKGYLFNSVQKPETYCDYIGFAMLIGFFSAIASVSGHELFHHKEMHNKFIGNWPACRMMYSQWIDEHCKGHHKHVSTH